MMRLPQLLPPAEGRHGARKGGALYPVLMIAGILLILSNMVPQVLVTASHAMRNDNARERLLNATECGIAVAEAKLKQEVSNGLMAGATPRLDKEWILKPSFENPDFGRHSDYTYEVKLVDFKFRGVGVKDKKEIYEFSYRLYAKGSSVKGQSLDVAVSGLLRATMSVDTSGSGIAARTLEDVEIHAFNQEL
jgi:hypothetical protein